MKCRTGFVSNSSSSSFIFALPKGVNSAEVLRETLYGKNSENFIIVDAWGSLHASATDISAKLFNSMSEWQYNGADEWYFADLLTQQKTLLQEAEEKYGADNYQLYYAHFDDHGDNAERLLHDKMAFIFNSIPHATSGHH